MHPQVINTIRVSPEKINLLLVLVTFPWQKTIQDIPLDIQLVEVE
jgi:hypothetical protein